MDMSQAEKAKNKNEEGKVQATQDPGTETAQRYSGQIVDFGLWFKALQEIKASFKSASKIFKEHEEKYLADKPKMSEAELESKIDKV